MNPDRSGGNPEGVEYVEPSMFLDKIVLVLRVLRRALNVDLERTALFIIHIEPFRAMSLS
jgi:hypothetical protein